ncbi:MAG: alpha/beta hydrolase family protein [Candidatus Bathyarchaeia archaeon]
MSSSIRFNYREHLKELYKLVQPKFRFNAKSREQFEEWQASFRPKLKEVLGLINMEEDLKGHVPRGERISVTELDEYIREKWYIWVEPTVPLAIWLLKPKRASGRLPLVLTPHGHNHPDIYVGIWRNEQERRSIEEGERDIAVQSVMEGYMTIAPTSRGFGETMDIMESEEGAASSCRSQLKHCLLLGRTPIGERVWDISRIIDWAIENLNVDPGRIAITGNSGGGTTSIYAAACDERIKVVVPSCSFCTFVGSIGVIRHCDCNYIPGILRLGEMYDIAGLIAPRPFCAIAGKEDLIFPIEHVKKAFSELKKIYEVAGFPERCELFIGDGGHRYYKAGAWPFIKKWLKYKVAPL